MIAHLAVHHLGFMYGGQKTSKALQENDWGKNSVALYQFPDLSKLLPTFSSELSAYLHGLNDKEYGEFTNEIEETGNIIIINSMNTIINYYFPMEKAVALQKESILTA